MKKKLALALWLVIITAFATFAFDQTGAISNLMGKTDAALSLKVMSRAVDASGEQGPRAIGNLMGKTDADQNLYVTLADGSVGPNGAVLNGTLTTNTTATCTAANTTETDLWTYSLPANTLNANGRGLRVTAWGLVAANANAKSIRFYFGGTSYSLSTGTFGSAAVTWVFRTTIIRTGAATEHLLVEKEVSGGNVDDWAFAATPAADTTAAIVIKVTGQNGTASAGDVCARGAVVETLN